MNTIYHLFLCESLKICENGEICNFFYLWRSFFVIQRVSFSKQYRIWFLLIEYSDQEKGNNKFNTEITRHAVTILIVVVCWWHNTSILLNKIRCRTYFSCYWIICWKITVAVLKSLSQCICIAVCIYNIGGGGWLKIF